MQNYAKSPKQVKTSITWPAGCKTPLPPCGKRCSHRSTRVSFTTEIWVNLLTFSAPDLFESTVGSHPRHSTTDLDLGKLKKHVHRQSLILLTGLRRTHVERAEPTTPSTVKTQDAEAEMTSGFPLPFHYIPYEPNKDFFGREDLLAKLRQHLYPGVS